MKLFKPLHKEKKSRKIFLSLFAVSSILPILIMGFISYFYILPVIEADGNNLLSTAFTYTFLIISLLPLISFLLLSRQIDSLERLTQQARIKPDELIDGDKDLSTREILDVKEIAGENSTSEMEDINNQNDIQILIRSFNSIFQTATDKLSEQENLKELLSSLIAVSSDLTSELDFNRLFPKIISRVTEVMMAERTSLYVIDWDNHILWTKVAEGIDMINLPIGKGISGRVAETGEMINTADAWELSYFDRTFDQKNHFRTRSVLCVPVKNRTGQNIGVLQAINKKGNACFDRKDEIFIKGLASQVGIALENSLLLDEIKLSFNNSISTLSAVVDARHPLTAGHSMRVTEYCLLIAEKMQLSKNDIEVLRLAALLHDIGKIGICDAVLLKNGAFTPDERAEMNTHPVKTKMILEKFHFPRHIRSVPDVAYYHHEKINGKGYPEGLTGDKLPLGSKIIAVADVFDALTSPRDYPKYSGQTTMSLEPMPLKNVISLLQQEAGSHFEPAVVEAFLYCLPKILTSHRGEHFTPEYVDETILQLTRSTPPFSQKAFD